MIDLEASNDRCIQLGHELKSKISEVEKLRIFKFMARQADFREDNLRAQVSAAVVHKLIFLLEMHFNTVSISLKILNKN